jgi:hypothetical protein
MWTSDLGAVVLMFVMLGGVSVMVVAAVYLEDHLDPRFVRKAQPVGSPLVDRSIGWRPVGLESDSQVLVLSAQRPMRRLLRTHVGDGRHVSRQHCLTGGRGPDRVHGRPSHLADATPCPVVFRLPGSPTVPRQRAG